MARREALACRKARTINGLRLSARRPPSMQRGGKSRPRMWKPHRGDDMACLQTIGGRSGVCEVKRNRSEEQRMTKVIDKIVRHEDGWAYKARGTFSQTFPTHDAAVSAIS